MTPSADPPTPRSPSPGQLPLSCTEATGADEALLLELVREFHASERLSLPVERIRGALQLLLADRTLGRAYLARAGDEVVGYMMLGFGFSLEFLCRDAFVDELYVRDPYDRFLMTRWLHPADIPVDPPAGGSSPG